MEIAVILVGTDRLDGVIKRDEQVYNRFRACHRIEWQFKVTQGCQHHHLSLLSECPNCGARFKVPALWVDGWCHRCFTPFGEMVESQRTV